MKRKIYHMHGKTTDQNGLEHVVTMVGESTQETEEKNVATPISVINENDRKDEAILIEKEKQKIRKLRYDYSICHPQDVPNFNEELGVTIAKRRIKSRPLGELTTKFRTSLCPDQIELILFGELKHVMDNIDKFIGNL